MSDEHRPAESAFETVTVAGGCFWCVEAVFLEVDGLVEVESGYSNGLPGGPAPTYERVCEGDTGYAEVVRLVFDPARIGLAEVLAIFFAVHDPTTPNRQGNDIGTQYRSGVYWHDAGQRPVIEAALAAAAEAWGRPVVTEVAPVADWTPAEAYHHRYFRRHPGQGYCAYVVAPKVGKFRQAFAALRRDEPLA